MSILREPAIIVALIVACGGILGPLMLGFFMHRAHRSERAEDFARQDAVASTASKVAGKTHDKLDEIHTLVNHQYDVALETALEATRRELVLMHEVIALRRALGHSPDPGAYLAIKTAERRAAELEKAIAARQPPA